MQSNWRKTQFGRIILIGLVLAASALSATGHARCRSDRPGDHRGSERRAARDPIGSGRSTSRRSRSSTARRRRVISRSPAATTATSRGTTLNVTASSSQYIISMTVRHRQPSGGLSLRLLSDEHVHSRRYVWARFQSEPVGRAMRSGWAIRTPTPYVRVKRAASVRRITAAFNVRGYT